MNRRAPNNSRRSHLVWGVLTTLALLVTPQVSFANTWHVGATQIVSGAVPGLPASCEGVTSEGETFLASEPGNTDHLVAVWSAGAGDGANTSIAAVSRDGGATWGRTLLPSTGPCTGGPGDWVIDQWVTVGRGGGAYYESFAGHNLGPTSTPFDAQTLVAASPSGGSAWPAATILDDNLQGARGLISRTSITADPNIPGRAWAVWSRLLNPVLQGIFVARTDDGGATWHHPVKAADAVGGAAAAWQLVVRPDGGIVLFYGELGTLQTVRGAFSARTRPPSLGR